MSLAGEEGFKYVVFTKHVKENEKCVTHELRFITFGFRVMLFKSFHYFIFEASLDGIISLSTAHQ